MAYSLPITVPSGSVTAALTNFPLFLDMSTFPNIFWSGLAYTDGRDIRVTNSGGTVIPFDLVSIDYGLKKGCIFVKTSLSNISNTLLYVTYGDPSVGKLPVTDPNGRNAVWSDYHRVFCYGDLGCPDRTGNAGLPTVVGMNGLTTTATSPQLNSHQGIAFDGTYYYTTDTNAIYKWNTSWVLQATNANPIGDIGNGVNHCGDLAVHNGILYVPAENYTNISTWSNQRLAKFNASNLTFISSTSVSAQGAEVSGVCYNDDDGYLYVASYADGSKFWKYDTNFNFIGTVSLSQTINYIQGFTFFEGGYYVQNDIPSGQKYTWRVEKDGTVNGVVCNPNVNTLGSWEGITSDGSSLIAIYSASGTAGDGVAKTMQPRDVVAYSGANFPSALSSVAQSSATRFTIYTIGATVNLADKTTNRCIASYGLGNDSVNTNRSTMAYRQSSDRIGFWDNINGWLLGLASPSTGTKYRCHATQNNTTSRELFINGVSQQSQSTITAMPPVSANALWSGLNTQNTEPMEGDVGFVYLRNSVLTSQWLLAESNNLSTPGSFYTVGTPTSTSGLVVTTIIC